MASRTLLPTRGIQTQAPFTVEVQGPHADKEDALDHRESLLSQLKNIPKETSILTIEEDTPSNSEWDILGNHFTSVRDLTVKTGFNEELNDKTMPLHWPLDSLRITDACGEVIKSPHILQGKLQHLTLFFTCGLRFEGPTSAELSRAHHEAVDRGDAEVESIGDSKIKVVYLPDLAQKWVMAKYDYDKGVPQPEPENRPVEGQEIRLKTVEIIYNDALDTFQRMCMGIPHVADQLTSLTLYSVSNDFSFIEEECFGQLLRALANLQTLNLTVGEVFEEEASLPGLYTSFPPNLTTLNFRGPISLCQSERWEEWITAFGSKDFLPKLENLAFVLDLHHEYSEYGQKNLVDAPEEDLQRARGACNRLYEAARGRGISIQPLHDKYAGEHVCLRPVDHRWSS
ncbi:hypothetical protein BJX99DRAFT_235392 [Aspergillus californicus]